MRRIVLCLALFATLAVSYKAYQYVQHLKTNHAEGQAALEVTSNGAVSKIADGLYVYKNVDTRRGPQCVELAERFYITNYPGTFPYHNSGPGAYDIWDGIANKKDVGGWSNYRQNFVAYENGTTAPQTDDMLLYDRTRGGGWGHIAIIAEVHPEAIVILEQNSRYDTRKVLPLVGNQIIDKGVQGVVRLKKKDHPQTSS